MADPTGDGSGEALAQTFDTLTLRQRDLELGANGFSRAMSSAFSGAVTHGRQFDDMLKSLTLRLSDLSVRMALRPLTRGIASGFDQLFAGLFGSSGAEGKPSLTAALGAIKPFAAGGVIGTPTYFPLTGGGVGLAGEAGPEAIMPLARGSDGRLGVAMSGGGGNVTIHIATPDIEGFRRSETYLTGQIARAVARGQRGL